MKTEKETLQKIKAKWETFIRWEKEEPGCIFRSNMLHQMSGTMQNCYDLIWLIETLEKKLEQEKV